MWLCSHIAAVIGSIIPDVEDGHWLEIAAGRSAPVERRLVSQIFGPTLKGGKNDVRE